MVIEWRSVHWVKGGYCDDYIGEKFSMFEGLEFLLVFHSWTYTLKVKKASI